jgi:DNA-binding response OmpR family regulator
MNFLDFDFGLPTLDCYSPLVIYAFGTFEFDPESGELRKSGRVVALEPQPAQVLGLLLADAGEIVPREKMILARIEVSAGGDHG